MISAASRRSPTVPLPPRVAPSFTLTALSAIEPSTSNVPPSMSVAPMLAPVSVVVTVPFWARVPVPQTICPANAAGAAAVDDQRMSLAMSPPILEFRSPRLSCRVPLLMVVPPVKMLFPQDQRPAADLGQRTACGRTGRRRRCQDRVVAAEPAEREVARAQGHIARAADAADRHAGCDQRRRRQRVFRNVDDPAFIVDDGGAGRAGNRAAAVIVGDRRVFRAAGGEDAVRPPSSSTIVHLAAVAKPSKPVAPPHCW